MCLHSWNVFFPHSIRFRPRKYITIVCRSCEQVFWGWCSFFIFVLSLYQSKSQMYMYGAKSNLGKSKFQANAVSGLTLIWSWSVGCPQGLLLILCLMFYFMFPFRADHCAWSVAFALKRMLPANTPPPLFGLCIGKCGVKWVFSTEFLQCDSDSWRLHAQGGPTHTVGLPRIFLAIPEVLRCSPNL